MQAILFLAALFASTYAHPGSCEDHFHECGFFSSLGHCDSNFRYMAKNCPQSCNVCVDPNCFDRDPAYCFTSFRQGLCRTSEHVRVNCPHSCDICKLPESIVPKNIINPDFECGRPVSRSFNRGKRQIVFPDDPGYFNSRRRAQQQAQAQRCGGQSRTTGTNGRAPLRLSVSDAFCGATVIHERFLITAAHCVFNPEKRPVMVRVGELDFSCDSEARSRPADYRVKQITVHPKYKRNSLERYNDIAIIETVEKMQFNELVYPHCISNRRPAVNSLATGSGFGFVNQTHRSAHAQEANFLILDGRQCEARYANEGLTTSIRFQYPRLVQGSDIICATFPGADACQGDSGGPLYQYANGRRYLVGVISQGLPCSGQQYFLPGFYVSVADHVDFINSVIYPIR
ncbi:trypsin-1-like [Palaemon carinicauda]|uniref:trypsin-1-like n=1 Tax=Palaemon carinicauda TaxID=392227 RepID=UPI0035B68E7C